MLNNTLKRVTDDISQRFNFNTAISAVMELVNSLYYYKDKVADDSKNKALVREVIEK